MSNVLTVVILAVVTIDTIVVAITASGLAICFVNIFNYLHLVWLLSYITLNPKP